jgi:hypothetical protein
MIKVEQSPYIIKELVKVADSFDQLHPAELSNAALILKATSDLLIEYPEQSVFKLDSLDTATSGSLLVGTAAIRTFSPDTLLCKSTGKLLVGYDDLIRVVDTNLMAEQETIKGGGRLNYIRPTQNGAIATFDMSIFILNPEGLNLL